MSSCSKICWKYNLHKPKKLKTTVKSLLKTIRRLFLCVKRWIPLNKRGTAIRLCPKSVPQIGVFCLFFGIYRLFFVLILSKIYIYATKKRIFMNKIAFLVGRGGFEPPKSKTSDLQSDPFGRSGICPFMKLLEPVIGLEPTTCWLQISCSANWATPARVFIPRANHR